MDEQAENLERVSLKIARHVLQFCADCLAQETVRFHASDLCKFVIDQMPNIAPDSPSRILRDLRRKQQIDYKVISRKDSLYEVIFVDAMEIMIY